MVMKLFNILYAAGLLLLAAACEKDLPTFSDDEGFLIFNYGAGKKTGDATVSESDRRGSYSFLLNAAEEQTRDTVWLKVNTLGKLSPDCRPIVPTRAPSSSGRSARAHGFTVPSGQERLLRR